MSEGGRDPWPLPQLGNGVDEVVIQEWMIDVGEVATAGETVLVIETDKASMELPAPVTGTLVAVLAKEGDAAEVGDVIAEFERAS